MSTSFATIFDFLDQFEPQVSGHSVEALDPALRAKVDAFARGELSDAEQDPFIKQLQLDPQLQTALTEAVKGLRSRDSRD